MLKWINECYKNGFKDLKEKENMENIFNEILKMKILNDEKELIEREEFFKKHGFHEEEIGEI